ncbi:MAG: hypothetical protein CVU89_03945 [Firmicutes bacterium HGW-Firmicutes-14]|jgi:heme-degrading monooxygenase HmoA|nr:MAG: hypothetical protein CVU89_03945 [Firmicutes bacterium HGW-Firmicutes-14]
MYIALSKIKVRSGHKDKVLPVLKENSRMGSAREGYINSYLGCNDENNDEILVFTIWKNKFLFEEARKSIKKDPQARKTVFQLLLHLTGEPKMETFSVIE